MDGNEKKIITYDEVLKLWAAAQAQALGIKSEVVLDKWFGELPDADVLIKGASSYCSMLQNSLNDDDHDERVKLLTALEAAGETP